MCTMLEELFYELDTRVHSNEHQHRGQAKSELKSCLEASQQECAMIALQSEHDQTDLHQIAPSRVHDLSVHTTRQLQTQLEMKSPLAILLAKDKPAV